GRPLLGLEGTRLWAAGDLEADARSAALAALVAERRGRRLTVETVEDQPVLASDWLQPPPSPRFPRDRGRPALPRPPAPPPPSPPRPRPLVRSPGLSPVTAHSEPRRMPAAGVVLIVLAAVTWGTTGSTMKLVARDSPMSPLLVGFFRMAIAAPCLVLVARAAGG